MSAASPSSPFLLKLKFTLPHPPVSHPPYPPHPTFSPSPPPDAPASAVPFFCTNATRQKHYQWGYDLHLLLSRTPHPSLVCLAPAIPTIHPTPFTIR
eukprot:768395-Hanusia_phi.AAC.1